MRRVIGWGGVVRAVDPERELVVFWVFTHIGLFLSPSREFTPQPVLCPQGCQAPTARWTGSLFFSRGRPTLKGGSKTRASASLAVLRGRLRAAGAGPYGEVPVGHRFLSNLGVYAEARVAHPVVQEAGGCLDSTPASFVLWWG